ncbi:hypothetical protein FDP41_007913 [Naegleria fowleri]|uniref:Pre-mRNA-splicing factor CWC15 n=1 Tax=Naegleria fowleri TaxID=5763 RepID=A0A6A5CEX7_NAEFO|nr:uncharacterized protein FDP41_007913 [Naegleria fowleri]KAF0983998.1 hypothetical protein FDP41_007913 [Naegleria fowleri]CAG4713836.1 unnamed protein product [Naegleria fowleri]
MSSANRPTFNPAKATETQGGFKRYVPSHTQSMYLLPAHTVLKTRQIGQNSIDEVKQKDLKKELENREKESKKKNTLQSLKQDQEEETKDKILSIQEQKKEKEDLNSEEENETNHKKQKSKYDDEDEDLDSSSSDDESDDSDNSDDEELMKELARIKKENAEKDRKELQQRALTSNPLLQPINVQQQDEESFTVKRKWTDSTVFKNQAREDKQQKKKRFINDTTRNDYHKEFMNEFMK